MEMLHELSLCLLQPVQVSVGIPRPFCILVLGIAVAVPSIETLGFSWE